MPFTATIPGLKYVHNGHHFTNSEYKSVYVMPDGIHLNHSSISSCPVCSLRWTKPLPAARCMGLLQRTAFALGSEDSVYSVMLTHDAKHVEIGFVNIVSGLFRHRTKISRSFIRVTRKLRVQNNSWTWNCPHSWSR